MRLYCVQTSKNPNKRKTYLVPRLFFLLCAYLWELSLIKFVESSELIICVQPTKEEIYPEVILRRFY